MPIGLRQTEIELKLLEMRQSLVVRCYRQTGNWSIAEDLAQETILEALRQAHKVKRLAGVEAWIYAICQNICLRWRHKACREQLRHVPVEDSFHSLENPAAEILTNLDRVEITNLLEQAMDTLPPITREVLVQKYVENLRPKEIADRLGLNSGVVNVRMHRGKAMLRHFLLSDDAYMDKLGLTVSEGSEQTNIWCYLCGKSRLQGTVSIVQGMKRVTYECMNGCAQNPVVVAMGWGTKMLGESKGYRRMLDSIIQKSTEMYLLGQKRGYIDCTRCGLPAPLTIDISKPRSRPTAAMFRAPCNCGHIAWQYVSGLSMSFPQVQTFIQKHSRVRRMPAREVVCGGRRALLIRFESVLSSDSCECVIDASTLQLLRSV